MARRRGSGRGLRVIAGELRGRRLRVPPGGSVRPTSERVREAVFSTLGDLRGCSVLDLFAGSGSLGIEALSRGASTAVFVERDERTAGILRRNLRDLGLEGRARVLRCPVGSALAALAREGRRFERVFVDPPYGRPVSELEALLAAIGRDLLAEAGVVVVEGDRRDPVASPAGLEPVRERTYGDTRIVWLSPVGAAGSGADVAPAPGAPEESMTDPSHPLALFPASFDPVTNGHLDLIHRARRVFDRLVVAVAHNVEKKGLFTVEERLEMLASAVGDLSGIELTSFDGLLVDYAREIGARVVIRGLRAMSDFEYEFEMALMNRHLYPEFETLFMMTSQQFFYVSSSRLKELVRFGADIREFVPPLVARRLEERLGRRSG